MSGEGRGGTGQKQVVRGRRPQARPSVRREDLQTPAWEANDGDSIRGGPGGKGSWGWLPREETGCNQRQVENRWFRQKTQPGTSAVPAGRESAWLEGRGPEGSNNHQLGQQFTSSPP